MKKRVIISTNENPNYYFYLPIVVAAWKKFGFSVTLIAVSNEFTEALDFAISKAKKLDKNFKVYQLKESEIRLGSMAQISRLYGFLLSDDYDEYIMTSDIDMIPMSDYFQKDDPEKCNFHGKDLTGDTQYPICYIGMKVINWYSYMQVEYGTSFETALYEEVSKWIHQLKSEDFFTYWDIDQKISTRQANRLEKRSPEIFNSIPRGEFRRLDRASFVFSKDANYIDLHARHNIQSDSRLFLVLKEALTIGANLKINWIDAYRNAFLKKHTEKIKTWDEIFQPESGGYDSHAPLLLKALEMTANSPYPVVEFGMGKGSTPRLVKYLSEKKRELISFDNSYNYFEQYKTKEDNHSCYLVEDWDEAYELMPEKVSMCFIDHAPGERRIIDIERMAKKCELMIIHDTETDGAGNYQYEKIWHLFEIIENYRFNGVGAMATLVRPI